MAKLIILIDAVVNLLLGVLLVIFPTSFFEFIGFPVVTEHFYVSILGAVLLGIAIALIIELYRKPSGLRGLGLGGAMAINICGASALGAWLLSGKLFLSVRGIFFIIVLIIILVIISIIELIFSREKKFSE